jgi:hypothetical protein
MTDDVPMSLKHRFRGRQYGNSLVRTGLLKNDDDAGLGTTSLPNGNVWYFAATLTAVLATSSVRAFNMCRWVMTSS